MASDLQGDLFKIQAAYVRKDEEIAELGLRLGEAERLSQRVSLQLDTALSEAESLRKMSLCQHEDARSEVRSCMCGYLYTYSTMLFCQSRNITVLVYSMVSHPNLNSNGVQFNWRWKYLCAPVHTSWIQQRLHVPTFYACRHQPQRNWRLACAN